MIVDGSGAVIISSNVLPVLWRIEPERFTIRRYELQLDLGNHLDVGVDAQRSGCRLATYVQQLTLKGPANSARRKLRPFYPKLQE